MLSLAVTAIPVPDGMAHDFDDPSGKPGPVFEVSAEAVGASVEPSDSERRSEIVVPIWISMQSNPAFERHGAPRP